jgi:membrane associated rhomboid family serine protease
MAAIHRYNPDSKPMATIVLVGLNITVAILDAANKGLLEHLGWARGIDIQYGEYWRMFTSGWVHINFIHIAFNAYGIYILGSLFERLLGWKPLLVVYFAALFGASALTMTFNDPMDLVLGASGSAYGLFGAVLGFFYVKAGSLRGLIEIPIARQLLLWLAIGVYISLQPGISFLGHLGGFIPGVFLGVFFEHRYMRNLDIFHKLGFGLMIVLIAGLSVFACFPVTRGSWHAAQALRAYEHGDFERGDKLLAQAQQRPMRDDGTRLLIQHLRVWRAGHERNPREFDMQVLRWPLTDASRRVEGRPFDFLAMPPGFDDATEAEPLDSEPDLP